MAEDQPPVGQEPTTSTETSTTETATAPAPPPVDMAKVKAMRKGVAYQRGRTWYWQDLALRSRSHTNYLDRKSRDVEYLQWTLHLWNSRREAAKNYVQK